MRPPGNFPGIGKSVWITLVKTSVIIFLILRHKHFEYLYPLDIELQLKCFHGIFRNPGSFFLLHHLKVICFYLQVCPLPLTGWLQQRQASHPYPTMSKGQIPEHFSLCSFLRAKKVLEATLRGASLVFEAPCSGIYFQR